MARDKKLPAIQWYAGDWRKDVGIQSLSFHDRGVWFEMLMLMHESENRGMLVLNGHAMTNEMIARAIGLDIQIFNQTLTTLLELGVADRDTETGAIVNRRMMRDEKVRKAHQEAGKNGGNPILLNQKANQNGNQNPTPSSSSSTSVDISDANASSYPNPPAAVSDGQKKRQKKLDKKKRAAPPTKTDFAKARHSEFKVAIFEYWKSRNPEIDCPWQEVEGAQLEMWLRASPTTTIVQFKNMLRNRYRSEVSHSDRPSMWIKNITSFANGALDRFGKPLGSPGGTHERPTPQARQAQIDAAFDEARRRRLDRERTEGNSGPDARSERDARSDHRDS